MTFVSSAALLDAVVLAVVSQQAEGSYGYRITQQIKEVLDVSESSLYPVLRRLQKDQCLTVHDETANGRNRRYYRITELGLVRLQGYQDEWRAYTQKIDTLFWGETP